MNHTSISSENPTQPAPSEPRPASKHQIIALEICDFVDQQHLREASTRAGHIMGILYPNGIPPGQLCDALGVLRVLDQLARIAARTHQGTDSPWRRVAAQGLLGAVLDEPGFGVTILADLDLRQRGAR